MAPPIGERRAAFTLKRETVRGESKGKSLLERGKKGLVDEMNVVKRRRPSEKRNIKNFDPAHSDGPYGNRGKGLQPRPRGGGATKKKGRIGRKKAAQRLSYAIFL